MMYFGTNQNHYADVKPQVPGMTMLRSYKGLSDTWPVMADGLLALLSIRPDPTALLAGGYDAQITGMLQTAPPGSLFTAWHEMDKNFYDPSAFPASVGRRIHAHMLALTHKVNPAVKYGSVLTQGAAKYSLSPWTISGLDFYGIDAYDLGETQDASRVMKRAFNQMPAGPRVVAETNSSAQARRPSWFREIFDWLVDNHGLALLTFWNDHGALSGPWVPEDAATVYALNQIAGDA